MQTEHRRERKGVGMGNDKLLALENLRASRKEGRRLNPKKVHFSFNLLVRIKSRK